MHLVQWVRLHFEVEELVGVIYVLLVWEASKMQDQGAVA